MKTSIEKISAILFIASFPVFYAQVVEDDVGVAKFNFSREGNRKVPNLGSVGENLLDIAHSLTGVLTEQIAKKLPLATTNAEDFVSEDPESFYNIFNNISDKLEVSNKSVFAEVATTRTNQTTLEADYVDELKAVANATKSSIGHKSVEDDEVDALIATRRIVPIPKLKTVTGHNDGSAAETTTVTAAIPSDINKMTTASPLNQNIIALNGATNNAQQPSYNTVNSHAVAPNVGNANPVVTGAGGVETVGAPVDPNSAFASPDDEDDDDEEDEYDAEDVNANINSAAKKPVAINVKKE